MKADFKQPIQIVDLHELRYYFTWIQPTVGFGECRTSDHEAMSKEWVRRALHAAVDKYIEDLS